MSRPRLVHPAWVISLFVSCLLVCLVFFPLTSIEASSTAQSVRSSDFDLPSALRQIQHQVRPEGTGFGLQNPENRLKAEFHDGAMTAEHPEGRMGLRLEGYGYGEQLTTPAPASVHAAGTRIEYQRGALTEWYINDVRGLEQGFTLRERPAGSDGGPLEIELSVSGNLQPALVGDHIELRRDGRAVLQYTGLRAWDSAGQSLNARMAVRNGRIRLLVADREAAYPITIDPWVQQQELTASDGVANDLLGTSVSVSGNTAVVGAPARNGNQGAAYVFAFAGGTWTQQAELAAGDGASGDLFGTSVSVNGTLMVVGAPGRNSGTGVAYVFTFGTNWTQQAELTASDGGFSNFFGNSVSMNGTTAIVGAYGNGGRGSAYVFTQQAGPTWPLQKELTASDPVAGDNFGFSVAVSGNIAVIGAPKKTLTTKTNQGVAYVFTRSGVTWTQQLPELTAKAPQPAAVGDNFGASVSVDVPSGVPTALIAAPQRSNGKGMVYVFTEPASTWTQQTTLIGSDTVNNDNFGTSVSSSGTMAIIGAPGHGTKGAAYAFTGSGATWTQQTADLIASDAAKKFGTSVSVDGTTALIGAPQKASSQGAAYVFDFTPWTITSANSTTFTVNTAGTFTVTTTGTPTPAISESGALPTGVTFVDNGTGSATIAGTPQPGTGDAYVITITAGNGVTQSASQTFTLTVDEPPTINSANNATFTVGTAGSFQVTTSAGFPATFSFSESGSLPTGVTLSSGGTLGGTPAAGTGNVYPITLDVGNGIPPDATQAFTLTVDQAPAITSLNSATFTAGTLGSFTATATGYPPPAFNKVAGSGSLPIGVNLDPSGVLSGTPASGTGGVYPFTLRASNGVPPAATQPFTLTVNEAPNFTSAKKTTFTVGALGTFTVTASGYPAPTFVKSSGSLPTGVTLTSAGILSGTPAVGSGGVYTFKIGASNGILPNATQTFTLTVSEGPAITSAKKTTFTVGTAGSFTVTTTGTPVPSLSQPSTLPSGVTFVDNLDGTATLSGTPAVGTGGVYPFTITATNGVPPDGTQNFTLTINEGPAFTSANNTTFTVGALGSFNVTASGTPSPTFTEVGALPSGVTLSSAGLLKGTPAAGTGGTYPITITAKNSVSSTTQAFTLTVDQAPAITSANHATFTTGIAGTFQVTASGFPTSMTFSETGTLPTGVTLSLAGLLSGTPAAGTGGLYPITITASNGISPDATQNFTLTVDQPPAITSANNTTFTVGTLGSFTVTATGYPAPTFTETGALPAGVTLSTAGVLSGNPLPGSGGVYSFTITAKNGVSPNATQAFTLTVDEAPSFTSLNYAGFSIGQPGSFLVTTLGYPYPSIIEAGILPNGLNFVDNGNGTGTLSGTPLVFIGGNFLISFTAQNGIGSATQPFTIILGQAPVITSANSAAFTYGVPNSFTVMATGFPTPSLSETGGLPAGVTFVDNGNGTGTLSGTPVAAGNFNLVFLASNAVATTTQPFTLNVAGLAFTPSSVNFYTVYLNSSTTVNVKVTNFDTFAVNITGVSITPGTADAASYQFVNHCTATLKPNAFCTIAVTFVPDTVGALTATLNLTDNAPGSPQQIGLSGIVIDPAAQFSPSPLAFGTQAVGSSTTLPVQLTNSGLTPLIISSVAITGANSGEFTQVNNCPEAPQSLPSTMSCTISVTFAPTVAGSRTGTLTVTDNVATGKSAVSLSGKGQ